MNKFIAATTTTTMLALAAAALAGTVDIGPVRLQEIDEVEAAATLLERGETVWSADHGRHEHETILRVGDGLRSGGRTVIDPWSIRATSMRLLHESEYAVMPAGAATWTNGRWELLPARVASASDPRTGTVTILTDAAIAAVLYDEDTTNATTSLMPADYTGAIYTNAMISASEDSVPFVDDVTFYAAIEDIRVYAWTAPHLLGTTNDLRHTRTLFRSPALSDLDPQEAVPRATLEPVLHQALAPDWWRYSAQGAVRLDGQPLRWSATLRQEAGENTLSWIYRTPAQTDRVVMQAEFRSGTAETTEEEFEILQSELDGDPVEIWISATIEFDAEPWIEWRTNLVDDSPWVALDTTTDWPQTETIEVDGETRTAWKLWADRPDADTAFFRVSGSVDSEHVATDYIEFRVYDLRNTGGTISARGFRWIDETGTNFVAGTNGTYDVHGVQVTLHGGIVSEINLTGALDYYLASNPSNYTDFAAVTNIVMTSYALPYDASTDATAGTTNALEVIRDWGSEVRYEGGTNAVTVSMADEWGQYAAVGMVSLAVSNSAHDVLAGDRIDTNSWYSIDFKTNGWSTVSLRRNYGETLWYAVPFSQ